jgi:hypothetical protein
MDQRLLTQLHKEPVWCPQHEATIRTSDDQSIVPIKQASGDEGTGMADASKRKADSTEDIATSDSQRKKMPRAGYSNYSLPLSLFSGLCIYVYLQPSLSLFFLDKFKEPELAINESEILWLDVARTISTFQAEASITSDLTGKTDNRTFYARRPVHVPKHVDVLAPHFMEYACWDLVRFQRRICERPFDKDGVISEIDDKMKWWNQWFKPAAPGLSARLFSRGLLQCFILL